MCQKVSATKIHGKQKTLRRRRVLYSMSKQSFALAVQSFNDDLFSIDDIYAFW